MALTGRTLAARLRSTGPSSPGVENFLMTAHDTDQRAERLRRAIRLKKAAAGNRPGNRPGKRPSSLPARPADQARYLGELQRGLWLAHRLDPTSPAYNLSSAFRFQGSLEAGRLDRAFKEVVSRHRILRSTFRVDGDELVQVVSPRTSSVVAGPALERFRLGEGQGPEAGPREARREAREAFDLETGPLIRWLLFEEEGSSEGLLVLLLHHILADETSLEILWAELAEAYRGEPSTAEFSAREEPIQYDDFVYWQRQRQWQRRGERRSEELEYWRRRLDPLPDPLALPFERPPLGKLPFEAEGGESASAPGRWLSRVLSPQIREGIRRLAAEAGATPFMVYAFAFRLLLHRYTEGQRIAFATPVSTRSNRATAKMIGYFLNPVVVVTGVDEKLSVRAAVSGFSRELQEILSHASLPFQEIAEALSAPIFQAMFVYQVGSPPPQLGTAPLEPIHLDLGASKFDLTFFVTEGASSLEVAVEYRVDRFDEVWMEGLLGHFETLAEHLPQDLERVTAAVPILGAEEWNRLRGFSRGPEPEATGRALLPRQILDQALSSPRSRAVICGSLRQSYGELESSVWAMTRELSNRGVRPGDRVGIFLDRSPGMIAGILASHRAGAAYIPLDPDYPEARNRGILNDAKVATVLTASALRRRLPAGAWSVIEVDDLGVGGEPGSPATLPELGPECPAYVLYTSGSSGEPKGVVVSHGNLRASTEARRQFYDASPKRFLLVPSVAFDSSVAGIFWTLATAGTLVIPTAAEVRDPRRLVRLMASERVTSLLCIPSLYAELLSVGGESLRGLEIAIVAGESCPSQLAEDHFRILPQVRLFNEYGPTEGTVWATVHEVRPEDAAQPVALGPVAIGQPIPGVRLELLDALGRPVPAGIPGHLGILGPTVAQGYWRRPDLTAERFAVGQDLWGGAASKAGAGGAARRRYRTGDRAAWTADGRLLFLGREDEQIKLRGFRIEPGEIEAALLEHPDVEEAAVVARPLGSGGARSLRNTAAEATVLVAFLRSKSPDSRRSWREDLATRLPAHMIPSRFVELSELPRLPNGKIDRRRLRADALPSQAEVREAGVPPRASILSTREQALISLWEGLLGRTGISSTDNFFELGGHSLLVVEMTMAIERDFEVRLSSTEVFENPTVEELARRLEQRGGSGGPAYRHLFPLQPRGRKMPFIIAVPHFFSAMLASRFRGERPVYGLRGVSLRAEGNRGRWPTMRDLGEELVDEIRRRFPDQTYIIAGYSFGASMAVEAVRVMEERGIAVHRLYLIAPMPVDFYPLGPFRFQIDGLGKPVEELSTREALGLFLRSHHPFSRRLYARLRQRLVVQPGRRLLCAVGRLRKMAGRKLTPRILHADVRLERFRLHSQYRPGRVQAPTVIFNAQETETDAAATWRPYFQGPLTIHEIPDPHLGDTAAEAAREVILRQLNDLEDP